MNGKKWIGKGKEYDSDGKFEFEGEYLNGEKNGIGKEYFDDKLIFEGIYLKGKRWNGKGKEYNYSILKLKYEGEYLNGKWNGKGKEFYYYNGKLIFEGEYLNGKRWNGKGYNKEGKKDFEINEGNGNVKEYNDYDELEYEGEYLNGERNGKGKEYNKYDQLIFEGEYLNGKRWNGKYITKKVALNLK